MATNLENLTDTTLVEEETDLNDERLRRIDDTLRTLLDVRSTEESRELVDLELQLLKIRARRLKS